MPDMMTTYTPTDVTTSVKGSGGGGGSDLFDEYLRRRMAELDKPLPTRPAGGLAGRSTHRVAPMRVGATAERSGPGAVETPWYSSQGAAMRPVGLQAGTIPGMGIDPRFLPPSMRAEKAELTNSPEVEASAALRARNQAIFDDMMAQSRQASRITDPAGGYKFVRG